ncbi:MAG TPA: hypothetical protein VI485_06035 [Vicinamibacterales bacterium]|nr:hypothetical protein [Vicinamibacterales bacterium]
MSRTRGSIVALVLCAVAAGCGSATVEGTYTGKGETIIDALTFKPGGKVDVTMIGLTHEGAFEIDGRTVTVIAPNGTRTPLTIASNGCLEGAGLVGTYCKDGSAQAVPATASAGASLGGLAQVYEGSAREGRITLEFGAARKVRLTMTPSGVADAPERVSFDVGYAVNGDAITVSLPGNEPLMLTRAGNDLEGTLNGETVRFVKR